jgi:peptidoglycan/LPS O-acetylase OafA/YrhL
MPGWRLDVRYLLLILVTLALIALDWAALHDIVQGEPDLTNEYAMLAFSMVIFGGLAWFWLRRARKTKTTPPNSTYPD